MTYEELIEETGAAIGIEGFAPDDDGVCMLVSDIGEIVIMEGASFCLDGSRAKLERLVSLEAFWREGGKPILMSLFRSVQAWRGENKI